MVGRRMAGCVTGPLDAQYEQRAYIEGDRAELNEVNERRDAHHRSAIDARARLSRKGKRKDQTLE